MQSNSDVPRRSYSSAVGCSLPLESQCSGRNEVMSQSVRQRHVRTMMPLGSLDTNSTVTRVRLSQPSAEHGSDEARAMINDCRSSKDIVVHHSRSRPVSCDAIMDSSSVPPRAGSEPVECRGTGTVEGHCHTQCDTGPTGLTLASDSRSKRNEMNVVVSCSEDRTPSNGSSVVIIKDTSETPARASPVFFDWSDRTIRRMCGESTLNDDYARQLRSEEVDNGPGLWYNEQATHLVNRVPMVDWICVTGIDLQLQRETIYRAIRHFDKLCSEKEISTSHLQVIAAACLLIATKWNEKEDKVPMLRELISYCNGGSTGMRWTQAHLKVIECKVLSLLDFSLKTILPIDFVQYHLHCGAVFSDDMLDGHCNIDEHPNATTYVRKFAIFFLDIIAQEYTFWKFRASVTAAAVLVASRRALRIVPYWNGRLVGLTGYDWPSIEHCFHLLWNLYRTKFPEDAGRAENSEDYAQRQSGFPRSGGNLQVKRDGRYHGTMSSTMVMKSQHSRRMNDRILVDSTLEHQKSPMERSFMDDDEKETSFIQ